MRKSTYLPLGAASLAAILALAPVAAEARHGHDGGGHSRGGGHFRGGHGHGGYHGGGGGGGFLGGALLGLGVGAVVGGIAAQHPYYPPPAAYYPPPPPAYYAPPPVAYYPN